MSKKRNKKNKNHYLIRNNPKLEWQTKLPKHLHPLLTMGVITKGELTIVDVDNNKTTIKKVGDALIEVTNTIHYGENKGDEPVEIIVFYAGNETTPTTLLIKEN